MKLVIVESPTKAKTIAEILKEDDAEVIASMGHIRDIPDDSINVDLETFKPIYKISDDKKEIVEKIKKQLKKSEVLYLATDEDREGESISWHLNDVLKPKVPVKRMVFHEITKSAIERAFTNTRDINIDMVKAQEARRVLDRIVGYKVSPILWKYLSDYSLSAGRVQSPTLRLVVEREYKRMGFKASEYSTIKAIFVSDGLEFPARLISVNDKKIASSGDDFDPDTGKLLKDDLILLDATRAKKFEKEIKKSKFKIVSLETKKISTPPPAPFITSTLQQEGNSILHFSSSRTMLIAQTLYEKGLITYMRTDSPSLSIEGTEAIRNKIADIDKNLLSPEVRSYKSKDDMAQEAHEAIRPSIIDGKIRTATELGLTKDEEKLYNLVYYRALASQMKDNIRESISVRIGNEADGSGESSDTFLFASQSYRTVQEGFRAVLKTEKEEGGKLFDLKDGSEVKLNELELNSQSTQPPRRWTESALIREMEKLGIGRPSTYTTTISSLVSKHYIQREKANLIPTFTGLVVIQFLKEHLEYLLDYGFTSNMESSLDKIERRELDEFEFLNNFYHSGDGLESKIVFQVEDRKEEKKIYLPLLSDTYEVYIGKFGPYISYNEKCYSIPKSLYPFELNDEKAKEIIENKEKNLTLDDKYEFVCVDEASGKKIYFVEEGKYGPYFFIEGEKKFLSLPKNLKRSDLSNSEIQKLFCLPILIASDPDGNQLELKSGRYGYYFSYKNKNKRIANVKEALEMDPADAFALFEEGDS